MISSLLLTFHLILFGVKAWAIFLFTKRYRYHTYMIVWGLVYIIAESIFLYEFWNDIDLGYYELIAVLDQCIFTIGLVFYLIKGGSDGKR